MSRGGTPGGSASAWRKEALSLWSDTRDPQFYGRFDVDAAEALSVVAAAEAHHGRSLGIYPLVVKAVATAVAEFPDLNHTLRRGRSRPHGTVALAQLAYDPADGPARAALHKYVVHDLHTMTLDEIARVNTARLLRTFRRTDPVARRRERFTAALPGGAVGATLRVVDWLVRCGADLSVIGFPAGPRGCGMVSNFTGAVVDDVGARMSPLSRAPFLITVPSVRSLPWVRDGQVVAWPVLRLFGTFDHRLVDGARAVLFGSRVRELLERPAELVAGEGFAVPEAVRAP
ncbi:2-oxo acid dehydrogenase subunit E2 [Amycolatopsis sp. NPDC005003]